MTTAELIQQSIRIIRADSQQPEYTGSTKKMDSIHKRLSSLKEFKMDEFKILGMLGFGTYGIVKAAFHIGTRRTYAIKFLSKASIIQSRDGVDTLCNEILLLNDFKDCNFLSSCCGICQNEDEIGIVQPLFGGGELFTLIDDEERLPETCRLYVAAEILAGLEEMHTRKYVYRDLKAENVLIGNDMHVRLTDFGFSKKLKNTHHTVMQVVGTPDYTAPEIILRQPYGFPADIWAYGVLLYELFCRMPPFNLAFVSDPECVQEKYERILSGQLSFPCGRSPKFVDLCSKILNPDPDIRYTLEQIKAHPFFKSIDWNKVKSLQTPNEHLPRIHIDIDLPCKNFNPYEDCTYSDQIISEASRMDASEDSDDEASTTSR